MYLNLTHYVESEKFAPVQATQAILPWFIELFSEIAQAIQANLPWFIGLCSEIGSVVIENVTRAAEACNHILAMHPYLAFFISLFIFIGPWILLPVVLLQLAFYAVLNVIGFGVGGISPGSAAAIFQGAYYGALTPAGSLFALLQSIGASYQVISLSTIWVALPIRLVAGAVAVYVFIAFM